MLLCCVVVLFFCRDVVLSLVCVLCCVGCLFVRLLCYVCVLVCVCLLVCVVVFVCRVVV